MYRIANIIAFLLKPWVTLRMPPGKCPSVYLTFDDGPVADSTEMLLQHLHRLNIKASFFLTGVNAQQQPDLVRKISEQGHAVCSHGWLHNKYRIFPKTQHLEELFNSLKWLETRYYRPPYGKIGPSRLFQLRKAGIKTILWNVDPADYAHRKTPDKKLQRLIRRICAGDIILLHDNPKNIEYTIKVIDHIFNEITPKGISFSIFS